MPDRAPLAVDEHCALERARGRRELASLVGVEALPVGVGEQKVVVLGKEANRSRDARRPDEARRASRTALDPSASETCTAQGEGARAPRASPSAATTTRRRPHSPARTRRGSARPRDRSMRPRATGRPTQVSSGVSVTCMVRPHTPRGGICTNGCRHRHAYARAGAWSSGKRSASTDRSCVPLIGLSESAAVANSQDGLQVDPDETGRELAVPRELGVEHRLHQRTHLEGIARGDEVDRSPHHDDANDAHDPREAGRARRGRSRRLGTTARDRDRAGSAPATRRGARPPRAESETTVRGAAGGRASRG